MAEKLVFILNDHNLQGVGIRGAIRTFFGSGTRLIGAHRVEDPVVCGDAILVTDNFGTGNRIAPGFVRERTAVPFGNFTGRTRIVIATEDGSCVTRGHYLLLSSCVFHFAAMRAARHLEGGLPVLELRSARLNTGTRWLKAAFHWFAINLGTTPNAILWLQ